MLEHNNKGKDKLHAITKNNVKKIIPDKIKCVVNKASESNVLNRSLFVLKISIKLSDCDNNSNRSYTITGKYFDCTN